jgi:RNA polymerase sigma factor (TIGR02999 family)
MDDAAATPVGVNHERPQATEELLPLVYEELRVLAAHKLAQENPSHTLQPTALVHEAWLRLTDNQTVHFANRTHFLASAATAMRRILVEHARHKRALRCGQGQKPLDISGMQVACPAKDDELLAVNEALEVFATRDPQKAELVQLRYFAGLTFEEAAAVLGVSTPTARRWWTYARAWLYQEIRSATNR